MGVGSLFNCFFLVCFQLNAFFFKFLLDGYDFLLFSSKLLANFMNLTLKLFLQLDDPFFSALQVCCFNSNFVFKSGDLRYCLIVRELPLLLFELPFLGQLINFFNFFLFKVRHEFGHLCSLPHFELPDDLVFYGVGSLDGHLGGGLGDRFALASLNDSEVFKV